MPTKTDKKVYTLAYYGEGQYTGSVPSGVRTNVRVINASGNRVTGSNFLDWPSRLKGARPCTTEMHAIRRARKLCYGSGTAREVNNSTGAETYHTSYSGVLYHGNMGLPTPDTQLLPQARSNAAMDFADRFRKKTRTFQTGVFMGEILETARGLARPAAGLRRELGDLQTRFLKQLQQLRRKTATGKPWKGAVREFNKNAADQWLEWHFGVKPLLSDLEDSTLAFRKMASGRLFDVIRIRGNGAKESASSKSYSGAFLSAPGGAGFGVPPLTKLSYLEETKNRCEVRYTFGWKNNTPSGEMPLPEMLGTTLSDFVPTVWEILPYSWLIDYFTNIGEILDAWSIRVVTFAWGQETVRNGSTRVWHSPSVPSVESSGGFTTYRTVSSGPCMLRNTTVDRTALFAAPVPDFSFELPGLGSKQFWNLTAFTVGRASSRRLASRG